jgi:hypothetical protein
MNQDIKRCGGPEITTVQTRTTNFILHSIITKGPKKKTMTVMMILMMMMMMMMMMMIIIIIIIIIMQTTVISTDIFPVKRV